MSKRRKYFFWRRFNAHSDLLPLNLARPDRYPFLLESTLSATGHNQGRYDILFAFPDERLMLKAAGVLTDNDGQIPRNDFLNELDDWFVGERVERDRAASSSSIDLPFRGGWFVYLGYELAAQVEPVLRGPLMGNIKSHSDAIETGFPLAAAWRVPAAIIRDRLEGQTILVAETDREALLAEMEKDFFSVYEKNDKEPAFTCQSGTEKIRRRDAPDRLPTVVLSEDPEQEFITRVQPLKEYIRAGDVFQVNLSRGWRGQLATDVNAGLIYQLLRQHNPGAFAGLAQWDDLAVISSSPERLVRVRNDTVDTRPIAGTHPRDQDLAADLRLSAALMAHPKERAEHIMLIDLERNDLGRICEPGSISVNELMALESYVHVHHIVSNIEGRLLPGATPGKILRAVFPGGTITGCPKVRCMEIIAELEQSPRGPYTGAMGYLNRDGDMDFNILIRTICRQGRRVSLRTGAGIVADSRPHRELEETRHKARGPLGVFEECCRGTPGLFSSVERCR